MYSDNYKSLGFTRKAEWCVSKHQLQEQHILHILYQSLPSPDLMTMNKTRQNHKTQKQAGCRLMIVDRIIERVLFHSMTSTSQKFDKDKNIDIDIISIVH